MFVYTADLHLTRYIWQDMTTLTGDAYASFIYVVKYAIENKASAFVIGGDLFNKPHPDSESVAVFMRGMDELRLAGIPVVAYQGQHERSDPPWACLHEYVECIGDGELRELKDGDTTFTVRAYDNASAGNMKQAMDSMTKKGGDEAPDVLMIHQLSQPVVDMEGMWDFDMQWVPKDTALVLAGDYHQHSHADCLWYPGSTHMRNTSQAGEHYFLAVELAPAPETKGKKKVRVTAEVTPILIPGRAVIKCLVNAADHVDIAIKAINDYDSAKSNNDKQLTPLVHLIYNPYVAEDALTRIQAVCREKSYFLRTKVNVGGTEVVDEAPQLGSVTLEQCVAQVVDRDREPQFFDFAMGLLTKEPRSVLDDMRVSLGIAKE